MGELKKHYTGRTCKCKGKFKDTVINFGESCNLKIYDACYQSHQEADLCLAMGSSMQLGHVTPMPIGVSQRGGNFVMINLQKTRIDKYATLVINGKCDDVMRILMKKLNYD